MIRDSPLFLCSGELCSPLLRKSPLFLSGSRFKIPGFRSASLPWFLLGGAGFLYLQLFVLPSTPIYQANDHWWFMQDARRMLDGEVLYRDIFQCLFPGTVVIYAALLKVFGLRTWIPNALLVLLEVLLAWTIVSVSRKLIPGRNAFLPAALLLSFEFRAWHVCTHHWFSVLAVMAAVLLALEKRNPVRLAGARHARFPGHAHRRVLHCKERGRRGRMRKEASWSW